MSEVTQPRSSHDRPTRTIRYGNIDVPVLEREWTTTAERLPYRKTYGLKPGQRWKDAPVTKDQWEYYVLLEDGPVPAGAMIARELKAEGATSAVFTEMWGGLVLVGPDLVCVNEDEDIRQILDHLRTATGGSLAGLPDVIGCFPNGKIAMREAKHVSTKYKDRLGPKQHAFARVAEQLFGDRLDLAVVEWGQSRGDGHMKDDLATLQRRITDLERENALLRAKVTFFDRSPWMRDGIRGEQVIAQIIGGTTTAVNERFDVLTASSGVRLEVKYSNLNTAVADKATKRWQWVRILGFDQRKTFDSLILIGEVDTRFWHLYRDPMSPYIIFEIPFARLAEVLRHSQQMIQISSNPRKARTPIARLLFSEFQTTCDALSNKYKTP